MSEPRKFTFKDRGVRLWLGSVLIVALVLLASRERGWWFWGVLGTMFLIDVAQNRQIRRTLLWMEDGQRRFGRFDLPYLTMYEGCCLWAGVILLVTMVIGFILF